MLSINISCPLCSCENKIFLYHPAPDGYTCAYCQTNSWLSYEHRQNYVLMNDGITEEEADNNLKNGTPILLEGLFIYD